MHDHLFDFSQPEVACRECHDEGDERLGRAPTHQWNIQPVRHAEALPVERTCARCHQDKIDADAGWLAEKLKGLKRRL